MRKVIAAFNMTLDGFCDHTSGIPADEIHFHYARQLEEAGVILYGRTTYQLMEYWRSILANPTGEKHMDDFAAAIDRVPKLVFSRTLKSVDWASARLATRELAEEVQELKQDLIRYILKQRQPAACNYGVNAELVFINHAELC